MDINLELINKLTANDIATILKLLEIKKEAESAYKIINEKIRFSIGETKKTIWKDSNNAEYLTQDGYWQARYLHQTYNVKCTVEGIFNAYKEEYLEKFRNGCLRNGTAESAGYFRSFIQRLAKEN